MVLLWIGFFICSAVVVFSGINLSRYGDVIAEKSGLGRAWIGLILMASITSLPEMITGISSVALVDAPDIAFGDVFGSCIYNLAILAVMDLLNGKRPLFFGADKGHILGAGFGIMLISIAVVSIIISPTGLHIAHIGFYTPLIIVIYIFGVRAIYYYEQDAIKEFVYETAVRRLYDHLTLKRAVVLY
ncbi:MAG: sodium:calcium antiporter, partial [Phycisphaerae bacterium]|nr:sodium:calcium antiporter [Phycisphaerae bacterium]NIX00133.1 sodium:calcium antiporter [Phycisphaerae bacterium]NIX27803.1 sodium:calcium antiporter [Phycisphaerae bacterium]